MAEPGRVVEVALALVHREEDDRWLVSRRAPGRVYAGLWEFPGGKLLPGETPEQAAVRETQEETGLSVQPLNTLGVLMDFQGEQIRVELHLILCRAGDGTAGPCDLAVTEIQWANLTEMRLLEMPPVNAEILRRLA